MSVVVAAPQERRPPKDKVLGKRAERLWLLKRLNLKNVMRLWPLLFVGLAGAGPEGAIDTVVLQQSGSPGRITVHGSIKEYTGKSLEIFVGKGGNLQTHPAAEVISVTTPQSAAHRRGAAEFLEGKYDAAQESLRQALEDEQRPWVRREILALSIRAALQQGDYGTAGARFLLMLHSDADTQNYEFIPLAWSSGKLDATLADQAHSWLVQPVEAARLIGASYLLEDEMEGESAARALNDLASSTDDRIRSLARAQLWRKSLRSRELPLDVIERWEARVDEMPERLRGGPWYVVGQGYLARGEAPRAAAALLWLPLVFDHDRLLCARACVEAADALATIGRNEEAGRLYAEAVDKYRGTPAAARAAEAIRNLNVELSAPQEKTR